MKIYKPKFWSTFNLTAVILLPISLVVSIINILRKKLINPQSFNIPIICIGNIYIGGTGKTPASIFLAEELTKNKKRPAIVRKFYENYEDEQNLIKSNFSDLILGKTREEAIRIASKEGFDTIILDDGFQDYRIQKNISILCFNQNQLIGNGFVMPSGPLRENLNALKYAEIILINGDKNKDFEKKIFKINKYLNIFYSKYNPVFSNNLKNKKVLAFAGIGSPENFFKVLLENGFNIQKKISFPDHYKYKKEELENILIEARNENLEVITTEKDFHRIKGFKLDKINYIKLELEILEKDEFLKKIKKIYD